MLLIIPTVIYELHVCEVSNYKGPTLYSIFGLRVPDDGTVTFYREIKLIMGFGVGYCCCYYDRIYCNTHRFGRPQITTGHRD